MSQRSAVERFRDVYVLRPLASEEFPDERRKPALHLSSQELEQLRQHPQAVTERFEIPSDAPKYRVLGRSSDGFLIVTGDPQTF
jgi:hypothetical protein